MPPDHRHHIIPHNRLPVIRIHISMAHHLLQSSSSHHTTPSPSGHPVHSPGVDDEHTSTSRRPPTPHHHSSAKSSSSRLRSSIPQPLEEIPDFFRPPTAHAEGEKPLIYLIAEHVLLHPSSVSTKKLSLVFKRGYLKEGWKWEYVPQSQRDIYWLRWKVFFTWDLPMSFAIYDVWCRRVAIRYTGNIYLIAKKRIAPIYLTEEVFEHYKRMRATDEAFKKKFEQISSNIKSDVGGAGTGISLHSTGSISARQHGDTLEKKLQRRPTWNEMFRHLHTHGHDGQSFVDQRSAKIDVKGRVYGLGLQGYHHSISSRGASSSLRPAYALHELEKLQQDHQRLQETLLKERMERQEQMQKDKMERQEETREMQDRLARMEALSMQHLGIRPHVPLIPRTPPSPGTERSSPQSDDHPGHLTTEITPSQSAHPHDHRSGHWTSPHRRMSEDQRHLLDDHDEFMEQLMPPP
ncbi:hypothetical protein Syun_025580 [Stephania yunnanensis]|uniref:Uncharacterized protein n=1 Tax=Stephania yunnanensis TaxID=152371 RepID=A0AAP0HWB2_9MAGN